MDPYVVTSTVYYLYRNTHLFIHLVEVVIVHLLNLSKCSNGLQQRDHNCCSCVPDKRVHIHRPSQLEIFLKTPITITLNHVLKD